MLFNLYVADLPDILPSWVRSFQCADETTLYISCDVSSITCKASTVNASLTSLTTWSKDSNLALNAKKTKTMVISITHAIHPFDN